MKDISTIKNKIAAHIFSRNEEIKQEVVALLKIEFPNFKTADFKVNEQRRDSFLEKINGVETKGFANGNRRVVESDELRAALVEMELSQIEFSTILLTLMALNSDN